MVNRLVASIDACIKRSQVISVALLIVLVLVAPHLKAQSFGLQFASRDADPERRTSLDLTPDQNLCDVKKLQLQFDLSFLPNDSTYFGYVFRVINDKKQNLDMLYEQSTKSFKIVLGDAYTGISINIPSEDLLHHWINIRLEVDQNKSIAMYVNGKELNTTKLGFDCHCIKISFGASNYPDFKSSDVCPMKVKNIRLAINETEKYFWPLNESAGNIIMDSINGKRAVISNGYWLKLKHTDWTLLKKFTIKGSPSVAFNPAREILYIVAPDSLHAFSAKTAQLVSDVLNERHENMIAGNQSIFNSYNGQLYNFYTDQQAVIDYRFDQHQWSRSFAPGPLTNYWHVNKFLSKKDSSLYVVAGYGHLRYKNTVQRYSFSNGNWEMIKPGGDYFIPRYMSALGATSNGDTAYILGGYGSKDGDQLLNPKFYYDLMLFDVGSHSFKKIYSLKDPTEPFVFANSLVLDNDRKHFYALVHQKDQLNTHLQLIEGSLETPAYEKVGSPFPYTFFDTNSFADLYFCQNSGIFLAVTLYTNKENNTVVNIYSINYPPNRPEAGNIAKPGETKRGYFIAAGLIALFVMGFVVYFMRSSRRRGKMPAPVPHDALVPVAAAPLANNKHESFIKEAAIPQNARIFLFGNFEVISSKGENITKLFTPLLKELFLLLCINTIRYQKGVSPEKLIETLWYNKEPKDAINNRSVNIAKLKNILEKIDDCTLQKESGYWKLLFNRDKLYIDFDNYARIFSGNNMGNDDQNELIQITQRGPFLPQTDYQWVDNFKSDISNFTVDALLKYCEQLSFPDNAEKIITICNSVFYFDELNENALKLKCRSLFALGRHTLAKQAFEKFAEKYKEIYGEDFNLPYNSVISG